MSHHNRVICVTCCMNSCTFHYLSLTSNFNHSLCIQSIYMYIYLIPNLIVKYTIHFFNTSLFNLKLFISCVKIHEAYFLYTLHLDMYYKMILYNSFVCAQFDYKYFFSLTTCMCPQVYKSPLVKLLIVIN